MVQHENPNPADGGLGTPLGAIWDKSLSELPFKTDAKGVKHYRCPRDPGCKTISIHAQIIQEHVEKFHDKKQWANILCPKGCQSPHATYRSWNRHQLAAHGTNKARCPILNCPSTELRERGVIFKHLREAHSIDLPKAVGFPKPDWYQGTEQRIRNWAASQDEHLNSEMEELFLPSKERTPHAEEEADDGPVDSLDKFLKQLIDQPDILTKPDVAFLRGFSAENPTCLKIIDAMSVTYQQSYMDTPMRCMMLASMLDWIAAESPDQALLEKLDRDATLVVTLDKRLDKLESFPQLQYLVQYSSRNDTLYDVLYGLHVRGCFDLEGRKGFVNLDYTNAVCMLGDDFERQDLETFEIELKSNVRAKIPDEDERVEFWYPVLMKALKMWLSPRQQHQLTFVGYVKYFAEEKLTEMGSLT